jgi:SOS response regulatory protein OraA/RecX
MVLMKAAYKNDTEAILEIFKFWYERGFLENIDLVVFLLEYVSQTQEISRDRLKKMLDESKIDGGEIMPTLAQQMKEEFREELKEEFMQTLGSQLKDEGKKETAKELIKRGIDMDIIEGATGISREELDKMASIIQ